MPKTKPQDEFQAATVPDQDNTFLADALRPQRSLLGVADGFRFGFGFFLSFLLVTLIVGGLAAIIVQVAR